MTTVTQPMSRFMDFSKIPENVLEYASDRGTRAHGYFAAYAQGLWIPAIDQDCRGFFESFKRWFDATVAEVIAVEIELIDPALDLVGHPDLICRIHGDNKPAIVDYKTPAMKSRTWAGQLSAYKHLAIVNGYDIGRILSVQPDRNGGNARVTEYTSDPRALKAYLQALGAYRFFWEEK